MSDKEQDSMTSGQVPVRPERVKATEADNRAATFARVMVDQFAVGDAVRAAAKARQDGLMAGIGAILSEQRAIREALSASTSLEGVTGFSKTFKSLLGGSFSVSDNVMSSNFRAMLNATSVLAGAQSSRVNNKAMTSLLGGALNTVTFREFQKFIRPTIQRVRAEGDGEDTQGLAESIVRIANSYEFQQLVRPSTVRGEYASGLIVGDRYEAEVVTPLQPAEAEVVASIAKDWDATGLSDQAKQLWMTLMLVISLFFNWLAAQNGAREELCFLQGQFAPGMTAGQWGKTIRTKMCETPLELLEAYRFIDGSGVRLRAKPSRKAAILPESLSHGQLVEVQDSSDKSWLKVKLVGQDLEGWVYRRYTHKLTK